MAVCTAWHNSPSPPYDRLGLVTLTFVLEKRKRLRERMQYTEYFWIISLRISSTPSCICSNKPDVRSLCILWAHSLSSCVSFFRQHLRNVIMMNLMEPYNGKSSLN